MTMPVLINNYQKKVTVTKLKKFYSVMNQAIMQWEYDEGLEPEQVQFSNDMINNEDNTYKWFADNIWKYINTLDKEKKGGKYIAAAFNDGSGFRARTATTNTIYITFCTSYKYCENITASGEDMMDGRRQFLFSLTNGKFITSASNFHKYTREELLDSCKYGNADNPEVSIKGKRHACTRLIEYDGWEIKKDYPWDQTMLEK